MMKRTIAIIGAGFSGTATAIHLLTRHGHKPFEVLLINRHVNMARGVAYGTHSPWHLLNVPAGRMSLFPDRENDFLDFARAGDAAVTGASFIARSLYGHYLGTCLREAVDASTQARLKQVTGEVIDLKVAPGDRQVDLLFADGRKQTADRLVLAVGNYPPADPPVPYPEFFESPTYIRDPWAPDALDKAQLQQPAFLIGTGLTMMDVALELTRRGFSSVMFAVSRRGLLPQSHRDLPSMPAENLLPPGIMGGPVTIHHRMHTLRRHIRELAATGVDWRDVIGSLRSVTPALWQALDIAERRRFLRHLQPYWDSHRHRTAPIAAARLDGLLRTGKLVAQAGRILEITSKGGRASVSWKARHHSSIQQSQVATVINCTGPQSDLTKLRDPLIQSLLRQGLLTPDPLRLGLQTDTDGALLDEGDCPSELVFYTGPLLRARDWECTAVPELRLAALKLADRLAGTW
ncbi:MAG: FAD/NAD(P)-binding protein [Gammaproteobacteria bacterium]